MQKNIIQLNDIVIETPKNKVLNEIGNSKRENFRHFASKHPAVLTKFFEYKNDYQQTKFIKNVILFTDSEIKNATFSLRVFYADQNGAPSLDAVEENIIVNVKKGRKKNIIDILQYKIKMPKEGIYIGFEWLMIDMNKFEFKSYQKNDKKMNVRFEPSLELNAVDKDFTYNFVGGSWQKQTRMQTKGYVYTNNKTAEPAINLVLTD